jgi:putative sterol carrier protein
VFLAIAEGKDSAMQSWHNGTLKISGDMAVAQVRAVGQSTAAVIVCG